MGFVVLKERPTLLGLPIVALKGRPTLRTVYINVGRGFSPTWRRRRPLTCRMGRTVKATVLNKDV